MSKPAPTDTGDTANAALYAGITALVKAAEKQLEDVADTALSTARKRARDDEGEEEETPRAKLQRRLLERLVVVQEKHETHTASLIDQQQLTTGVVKESTAALGELTSSLKDLQKETVCYLRYLLVLCI